MTPSMDSYAHACGIAHDQAIIGWRHACSPQQGKLQDARRARSESNAEQAPHNPDCPSSSVHVARGLPKAARSSAGFGNSSRYEWDTRLTTVMRKCALAPVCITSGARAAPDRCPCGARVTSEAQATPERRPSGEHACRPSSTRQADEQRVIGAGSQTAQ